MAAIATNDLLEETKCYACYGLTLTQLLKLGLLRRQLIAADPAANTSASALIDYAKCYACYGASIYDLLELAFLDQISQV